MQKKDVLKVFVTQKNVARALSDSGYAISQAAVSKWPDRVPEIAARRLAEISSGLVFDVQAYDSVKTVFSK